MESPIENELPTYRAISKRRFQCGAICGALAIVQLRRSHLLPVLAYWPSDWESGLIARSGVSRHAHRPRAGQRRNCPGPIFRAWFGHGFDSAESSGKSRLRTFAKKYAGPQITRPWRRPLVQRPSGSPQGQDRCPVASRAREPAEENGECWNASMGPLAELIALRKRLASSNSEDIHFVKIERRGRGRQPRLGVADLRAGLVRG